LVDLDDPALLTRQDPGAMAARIGDLPESIVKAWRAASEFDLPNEIRSVKSVVITGMGGSAIGGDLVRSLAEAEAPIPVVVQRGYDLPAFAGPDTLVVAISHSGGTEETLSAADEAIRRGVQLVGVGREGSPLAERCEQARAPFVPVLMHVGPRATLWALATPLLVAADRLGTRIGHGKGHYDRALAHLREGGTVFTIGLAWEPQILDEAIPADPWDMKLDAIATPKEWIECR